MCSKNRPFAKFSKTSNISDVLASMLGVLRGYLTGNQQIRYGKVNMYQSNILNIINILSIFITCVLKIDRYIFP